MHCEDVANDKCGCAEDCVSEHSQLAEWLRELQRYQWIPTSVRMPSENGKYLCCWQGKSVETGMFLNGHFRLYGEIKDNLVTAWMPLPEPYESKGE